MRLSLFCAGITLSSTLFSSPERALRISVSLCVVRLRTFYFELDLSIFTFKMGKMVFDLPFKLKVLDYTKANSGEATAREFGIDSNF